MVRWAPRAAAARALTERCGLCGTLSTPPASLPFFNEERSRENKREAIGTRFKIGGQNCSLDIQRKIASRHRN